MTGAANPVPASRLTSDYARCWISVLIPFAFLAGYVTTVAYASDEFTFEPYDVLLGLAERQTVLTGFLFGGAVAELAVVNIDENDERRLCIYAFDDETWVPKLETTLSREVLFVDVANIGGRDRLITYEHGLLNWFDPESATERALVEVATNYNATPDGLGYAGAGTMGPADEGEIPYIDIARDLNGDGRDDLVLPDVDGFWISTQLRDGSFTEAVKLGPPEPFRDKTAFGDTRSYGEVGITALTIPWYLSRVHEMDYDQDGRSDLAFWNEDHFDVHLQDERGLFSQMPETFTVDVPFDSDGAYSLIFGYGDQSAFSMMFGFGGKTKQTVLHSLRDLNGDGVSDLLTHSLEGRSILRQRSRYEAHFGTPKLDGTVFEPAFSTAIQPRGKRGGMEHGGYSSLWLEDFDGDGQVDILRGDIKMGAGAMIRALLGTSISMGAEVYRMENGVYPDRATTKRKITADVDFSGGRDAGFAPFVLMGDVNGDGRSDFLVGKNREELHVLLGVPGAELFARQPQKVSVTLPGDERNTWLADLNRDNMQDILMHHPSTTEPHRVTMLVSQ